MLGVPELDVLQVAAVATDRAGQTEAGDREATDGAGEGEAGAGAGAHQAGGDVRAGLEGAVLSHLSPLPEEAPVVEEMAVGSHCSSVQLAVSRLQEATARLAVSRLQSGRQLLRLVLLGRLSPGVGAARGVAVGEEGLQPGLGGGGGAQGGGGEGVDRVVGRVPGPARQKAGLEEPELVSPRLLVRLQPGGGPGGGGEGHHQHGHRLEVSAASLVGQEGGDQRSAQRREAPGG